MRTSAPWLLLSTVAHGAVVLALRMPATSPRPPAREAQDVVEVTVETRAPDAEEARQPPPVLPTRPPVRGDPVRDQARRARPTPQRSPAEAPPPPADGLERAQETAPTRPSLSPRAVAQAALDAEPLPDAGAPARAPTPEERLNHAITAGVPARVDTIPDPVLQRGPEGGYVYEGQGFDAIIRPDGSVDMRDRFGSVHLPLVPYQTPTGEWRIGLLGGSLKLFEWLDRKFGKNDPFASERRWFLARTRSLREKMERDHYGKAAERGAMPAP